MKVRKQFVLLYIAILLLISSLVISPSYGFEGYYLGSSIGGILPPVNHFGEKITQILPCQADAKFNMKDRWSSARTPSFIWVVTSGYGQMFGKHYCGVEGMFHRARHRMQSSVSSQQLLLDIYDEMKVSLRDIDLSIHYRQGYALSDTFMIFGKIGVSRNKVKMHLMSHSVMKYPNLGTSYNFPGFIAKHKVVYPIKLALELEKKCWDNIALTFAYTYERHGAVKLQGTQTMTTPGGTMRKDHLHKVTVQNSAIIFGLKRYF